MINILYLITDLEIGGTEKVLSRLVTHLDKRYFNPIVVSLKDKGLIGSDIEKTGICVECLNMKHFYNINAFFKLFILLKKLNIHIIHSFLFHANLIGRTSGFIANTPIIISSNRTLEGKGYYFALDRLTRCIPDAIVCVSKSVNEFTKRCVGIPSKKIWIIYNGVDISTISFPLRQELGINQDAKIVVTLSRLSQGKGIEDFLLIAKNVIENIENIYFVIIGDGEKRNELEQLAHKINISSKIFFLGYRNNIHEILSECNIFVHPSKLGEGMPNAILEAMAQSLPVVAIDVGGCSEAIGENVTGYLVKVGDVKSLTDKVIHLLKNGDLALKMGEAGQKRIKNFFTTEKMVEETIKLYNQLL